MSIVHDNSPTASALLEHCLINSHYYVRGLEIQSDHLKHSFSHGQARRTTKSDLKTVSPAVNRVEIG